MAKPICIIHFPEHYSMGGTRNFATNVMQMLNGFSMDPDKQSDYWKEYYWFCFSKPEIDVPEFQVFHEKDFTEIQFEELRKLVLESVEKIKNDQDGKH